MNELSPESKTENKVIDLTYSLRSQPTSTAVPDRAFRGNQPKSKIWHDKKSYERTNRADKTPWDL